MFCFLPSVTLELTSLAKSSMYFCADHDHVKPKRRAGRRHKSQWLKQPMALSEIILELQDVELRENALRCLSGHLIEVHLFYTIGFEAPWLMRSLEIFTLYRCSHAFFDVGRYLILFGDCLKHT